MEEMRFALIPGGGKPLTHEQRVQLKTPGAEIKAGRVANFAPHSKLPYIEEGTVFTAEMIGWYYENNGATLSLIVMIKNAPNYLKAGTHTIALDVQTCTFIAPASLLA